MHSLQLDTRIVIEGVEIGKGTSGGITREWRKVLGCWAQRRDMSGNERAATVAAGGEVAVARVEFVIRVRDGLNAGMRVVHGGEYFNIEHVKPLADYLGWMVLTCSTGVRNA